MKCEDAANALIAYAGGRVDAAQHRELEKHATGCADCRTRMEQFGALSSVLNELPAVEPSFAFDARVRRRVAVEPKLSWFGRLVPQPRLALSAAMLVLLSVWVVKMQPYKTGTTIPATQVAVQAEDFNAIQDLGVLENYDILTKFDSLAETSTSAPQSGQSLPSDGKAND